MRRLRVRNAASSRQRLRLLSPISASARRMAASTAGKSTSCPRFRALVELRQGQMSRLGCRGWARDGEPISARDHRHAKLPLDSVEMLISLPVEQREKQIVVEFQLGAPFDQFAGHGGGQRAHPRFRRGERAGKAVGARPQNQSWNDLAESGPRPP